MRDRLADAFGPTQVFFDVDSLGPGEWRTQIERALQDCQVALVLIGPRWMSHDEQGRNRLLLVDDVHRNEIAMALSRRDLTVIPVLVDGARLPARHDLPDDLQALLDHQVCTISSDGAQRTSELNRLLQSLRKVTGYSRQRRLAVSVAVAALAVGTANTLTKSNSLAVTMTFLSLAAATLVASTLVYVRLRRAQRDTTRPALLALILALGIFVGSLVRLWIR